MVTECYIKGRFDFGVGKCAVVITQDTIEPHEKTVLHKVAWKVPEQWEYKGAAIEVDQYNCEILAATYALNWCMRNDKEAVNIYANTNSAPRWYGEGLIPDTRPMKQAYLDAVTLFNNHFDEKNGVVMEGRIFAEYIPKVDDNYFNRLVNSLAENLR